MKIPMRIAVAQINNTVGDLQGNAAKIMDFARRGERAGVEVVAFPELALTGYPPRDLVEKHSFLDRTEDTLQGIARESANLGVTLIVGYVGRSPANSAIRAENAAAVCPIRRSKQTRWRAASERVREPASTDFHRTAGRCCGGGGGGR